jgi:capsular polysaccharide biosynthesis protein
MELSYYLSIARRWAWLLILGLVLGIASGYGVARLQTPIYQASTRVIASRASMQAAPAAIRVGYYYYISDQQLMQTYIELLKSSSIFDKVLKYLATRLSDQVEAAQVKVRILSIAVEGPPSGAADIANAIMAADPAE